MADDNKKFDLELGTTADLNALDEAKRKLKEFAASIENARKVTANPVLAQDSEKVRETYDALRAARDAVQEAGEATSILAKEVSEEAEAQRRADVERVKATRSANEQAEASRKLRDEVSRLVAIGLAGELQKVAGKFKGVNEGLDLTGEMLGAISTGLATGNPFLAIAQAAVAAGIAIFNANKKAEEAAKAGDKQVAEMVAKHKAMIEGIQVDKQKNFLANFVKDGLAGFEDAMRKLQQMKELTEAQRTTGAAERGLAQEKAVRAGVDPGVAAGQKMAGDVEAELQAMRDEMANARTEAAEAQRVAMEARKYADELAAKNLGSQDEIDAAAAKAADAEKAAGIALEKIPHLGDLLGEKLSQMGVEQERQMTEAANAQNQRQIESAQKIVQEIEGSGKQLSASQQEVVERTKAAYADGVLTVQEQKQLAVDIQGVFKVISGSTDAQKKFVDGMDGYFKDVAASFRSVDRLLINQRREFEDLKRQFSR